MPLSALIKREVGGFTRNCKRCFFSSPGPGPSGPRLIHHCKDLSEAWSGGSPSQRGWKMSGTWGPQSQELLGSAPGEGRGLLGLETAQGRPLGRQRHTASEKWYISVALVSRSAVLGSPLGFPHFPQPRDQLWVGGKLTPQRSRHLLQCWGGDASEGGDGVSKQLWKVSKFRYLRMVSGTCILAPLHSLPPSDEWL